MHYTQEKHISNVQMDDIFIGNGVSELVVMTMQALLDNDDEVLIPMPDYPLWTASVVLAGGVARHYICDEQAGWLPDLDDMRAKISSKTRAIVIINPNNPTGALYPKEFLLEIIEIARQHQLIIYADEILIRFCMMVRRIHLLLRWLMTYCSLPLMDCQRITVRQDFDLAG